MKKMAFLLFSSLILFACSPSSTKSDQAFTIYTSIYPVQYAAEQIAGDLASVESLYPPGVDAHTYEPTTRQLTYIAQGDLFIYVGAGMESFAERTEEALQLENTHFLEIGSDESIFHENDDTDHEEHDGHQHDLDPHIWFDPLRMIEMGEMIKMELISMDPANAATFEQNFANYEADMKKLDQAFIDTLQGKKSKEMIVTHAAYGYWEERYGIEQLAISGVSSSDEPSQRQLVALVKEANERNLQYIVFEKNSSNSLASIIQDNLQAKAVYIHNLETLTEDDIEHGRDYLSIMQENLHVLDKITN